MITNMFDCFEHLKRDYLPKLNEWWYVDPATEKENEEREERYKQREALFEKNFPDEKKKCLYCAACYDVYYDDGFSRDWAGQECGNKRSRSYRCCVRDNDSCPHWSLSLSKLGSAESDYTHGAEARALRNELERLVSEQEQSDKREIS